MSGALAERDFVEKLGRAGFVDIEVLHRQPFGVDNAALYPLFTDDLVALMKRLIPPEKQDAVATAIVVRAKRRRGGRHTTQGQSVRVLPKLM